MTKKTKIIIGVVAGAVAVLAVAGTALGVSVAQKRAKCEHVWDDGTVSKIATCKEAGEMTFECEKCGKKEKEEIKALEHTWKEVEAVAPTCDKDGHTEYIVCTSCSEYKNGVKPLTLDALGHIEVVVKGYANTCTEPGKTDGSYCTRCEETVVEQVVIPASGHKLVDIKAVAPTCTEVGYTKGQMCETCEIVYVEPTELPATGVHNFENGECTMCELSHASVLFEEYAEADETSFQAVKAGDALTAGTVYKVDRTDYANNPEGEKVYMDATFKGTVDSEKYKAGLHFVVNGNGETDVYLSLFNNTVSGWQRVAGLELDFMELDDNTLLIYVPSDSYKLTYNNTVYEFTLKFANDAHLASFAKAI